MPAAIQARAQGKSAPSTSQFKPGARSESGPARSQPASGSAGPAGSSNKPEPKILFQSFFKSVGTRTYVAQVKESSNGNHFIMLTEGRRDEQTGDVRKTKLMIFSEDFIAFFKLLTEAQQFVRDNPVPAHIAQRQKKFWEKKQAPASK